MSQQFRSLVYSQRTLYPTPEILVCLSIAALLTNSEKMESSKMEGMHEWVSKTWCVCTVKFHLAIIENEIMKFVGKLVELENIVLNKSFRLRNKRVFYHTQILASGCCICLCYIYMHTYIYL